MSYNNHPNLTIENILFIDDAKDLGEFSLGLKGVFKVHSYEVKKSIKRGFVEASVTVSVIDDGVCVPVGENISGVMKRGNSLFLQL